MATSKKDPGIKYGFRSGLEEKVAAQLEGLGEAFEYEEKIIKFVKPESNHRYTPDFFITKTGIYIETKGRFVAADRQKHLLIKKQHPKLDIRFVFSRSASPISKNSRTTYAMWCEKNGFIYADKEVPTEWLQ